jgi:hypothetical protein
MVQARVMLRRRSRDLFPRSPTLSVAHSQWSENYANTRHNATELQLVDDRLSIQALTPLVCP